MTTPYSQHDQIKKLSLELSFILNYETRLERTTQIIQLLILTLYQAPFSLTLLCSKFSELFTRKIGIMYSVGITLIYCLISVRLLWKSRKVLEFAHKLKHYDSERSGDFLPKTFIYDKQRHHRYRIRLCLMVIVLGVAPYILWGLQSTHLKRLTQTLGS